MVTAKYSLCVSSILLVKYLSYESFLISSTMDILGLSILWMRSNEQFTSWWWNEACTHSAILNCIATQYWSSLAAVKLNQNMTSVSTECYLAMMFRFSLIRTAHCHSAYCYRDKNREELLWYGYLFHLNNVDY